MVTYIQVLLIQCDEVASAPTSPGICAPPICSRANRGVDKISGHRHTEHMEQAFTWIASYGYVAIFGLLVLGIVGLPVPDEALLTFVGYLNSRGELTLPLSMTSAFLGSASGISLSYALGRFVGPPLLSKLSGRLHLHPEHIIVTQRWMKRWGKYTLLIAYFVPGVRHLAALMSGMSNLPVGTFIRFAYTGALLWSSTFILIGYWLGEEWPHLSPTLHRTLLFVGLTVALLVAAGLALASIRARTRSKPLELLTDVRVSPAYSTADPEPSTCEANALDGTTRAHVTGSGPDHGTSARND